LNEPLNADTHSSRITDTDNDGLKDWDEVDEGFLYYINGGNGGQSMFDDEGKLKLPTIRKCMSATNKPYAEDGLKRFELDSQVSGMPGTDFEKYFKNILDTTLVLPIHSNPANEDSDGDGLLDGKAVVINGCAVAPKDPEPLKSNNEYLWKAHINQMTSGKIGREYSIEMLALLTIASIVEPGKTLMNTRKLLEKSPQSIVDSSIKAILKNKNNINSSNIFSSIALTMKKSSTILEPFDAALFLNFLADENGIWHSQVDTWQRKMGFNEAYDVVFDKVSKMETERFYFNYNNSEHVLWTWKGDYWNLGAGTEIGLYQQDKSFTGSIKHYDSIDYELPMTLHLYNAVDYLTPHKHYENIFSWTPNEPQWWITGFNSEYLSFDTDNLVTIGTVSFKGREDMYEALKKASKDYKPEKLRNLIFDDADSTVWLVWEE